MRENRGGGDRGGGFRRDFGEREMHDAVCSECGNKKTGDEKSFLITPTILLITSTILY